MISTAPSMSEVVWAAADMSGFKPTAVISASQALLKTMPYQR